MQKHRLLKGVISLLLLVFAIIPGKAQDLPVAGYDTNQYHPVFIQSSDGQFKLNIGLYTQFRYNVTWQQNAPDSVSTWVRGYKQARTRIFFEGDLTSKFYYHLRVNINPLGNWELFVAYLQWNINDKMWIRMGKQFMALGREDWMYPQDLATIEFSANDFTYAIWTSFGFQFRHTPNDKLRYFLSVGNGAYGGRQGFPAPDPTDLTMIARGEWNILGGDWGSWDNMTSRKGKPTQLLFGLAIGNSQRVEDNLPVDDYKSATQINADFSAAGNGFQFFVGASRTDRTYNQSARNNYVNGLYTTLGYWVCKKWLAYGRYDFVGRGNLAGASEDYSAPGVGVSFYPFNWTRRTRFSVEYNALPATITNTIVAPDGQLGWTNSPYGGQQSFRFQIQFGF